MSSEAPGLDSRLESSTTSRSWLVRHRHLILPLLGDTKIAQILQEEIKDYEPLSHETILEKPQGIRANLKPHQIDGLSFLYELRRHNAHAILADEMGLGKTLQILSFFQLVINLEKGPKRPFLVICPLSVLQSWNEEVKKWTDLHAIEYQGHHRDKKSMGKFVPIQVDIVITTYETAVSDIGQLARIARWRSVVLDEGHRIKNNATKLSKSLKRLKTDQRIIVTGTPVQNNLTECWSMLHWLFPEVFVQETMTSFKEAFCLAEGRFNPGFIEKVKNFLALIMLRRTKECTEAGLLIPPKKEVSIYLPLTEIQTQLYLEVLTGVKRKVELGGLQIPTPPASPVTEIISPSVLDCQARSARDMERAILNVLVELRKICVHPLLIQNFDISKKENVVNMASMVSNSSKFLFLKKLVEHEVVKNNKKMLLFSGFDHALDCCETLLEELGIKYVRLDGRTCQPLRRYNVHRFMSRSEYRVFVMASRAGGEGLTLTAAEIVVFLDSDFNPQVTAQAEARAHRIGQLKTVTVYKLYTRGTVEQQILDRINKKVYLASKTINGSGNAAISDINSDTVESGLVNLRNLICYSAEAVSRTACHPERLLHMDWEVLLKYCQNIGHGHGNLSSPPSSPGLQDKSCHDEARTWLTQRGRIQTGLFEGQLYRRPRSGVNHEKIETYLVPEDRRRDKNRVVYDEDLKYYISKESTLCGPWEAVPTLTNKHASKSDQSQCKMRIQHLKSCLFCGKTRNLQKCAYCPQVYHTKCIEFDHLHLRRAKPHQCPQHKCSLCQAKAQDAGGLLLVCIKCPKSYCIYCVELENIKPKEEHPAFQNLSYKQSKSIEFIECMNCKKGKTDRIRKRSASVYGARLHSAKRNCLHS